MTTTEFDVVIVGGGHAAAEVASALRRLGSDTSICIVSDEEALPYERPPLSKAYLAGSASEEDLLLREEAYWLRSNVEIRRGQPVVHLDPASKRVTLYDGSSIGYSKLVWATGGRARPLPVPGAGSVGVHYIRTLDGARRLRDEASAAKNAVVIGAGYIGMEAAAALRTHFGVENVTVIEAFDRVLSRVTSAPVSAHLQGLHESHGVTFRLQATVEEIVVDGDRVVGVRVGGGEEFPADVVIVGIGIIPNTEVLAEAGAACSNGVDTTASGLTSLPDVWSLGDCANVQLPTGNRLRLESAPNVTARAKAVAASILGLPAPAPEPAWFWSDQFDTRVKTAGVFTDHDELEVVGEPDSGSFSVKYYRDDVLIAVDTINASRDFAAAKRTLALPEAERRREPVTVTL